jgi:hypothetical protein
MTTAAFAVEKKPAFGFTNVSQAMMLHPLMAKFRIKEGRFSTDAIEKKSAQNSDVRKNNILEKQKELNEKQEKLNKDLQKLDQDLSQALSALNVKYNNKKLSSPGKPSDQYNKEKGSIETEFWKKRRELQKQVALIQEDFLKLNKENELLHLTSQTDTDRVFGMMLDDIYEAVDVVAKHYKIDFVFNSSFSVERTPINPSFTPANPMGSFFNKEFNRDAEEVLYEHGQDGTPPLFATLDYWCACQRWAFRNTVDPRMDKMILKGGLDMTPAVIDFVYQKHKIPASHRDIIQEFLKKQSNQ